MKILYAIIIFLSLNVFAEDYFLVDVRTQQEFKSGHLEDASNIEWQNISVIIEDIEKDKKIYLYCRSGNRSQKATNILIELGYQDVTNLGGLEDAAIFLGKKITEWKIS